MGLIHTDNLRGDPRKTAVPSPDNSDQNPHGLTPRQISEMSERFDSFLPKLATSSGGSRNLFDDTLPEGASWSPRQAQQMMSNLPGGSGAKTQFTQQQPYMPEFSDQSKQSYPIHRILANRYWRLFYKLDPLVGQCIEIMGDLPWSQFKLKGPGVDGSILRMMEDMVDETQLLAILPSMVREFLVTGEALPHLLFDDDKGHWSHIAMHNPDQIEVIDAPFLKMDPILQFIPDDRLRAVITSTNPQLKAIRDKLPPQLLSQLQARQNIPLSPVNATFIPRKLHPYDTRGTSIFSRLWRIFMYEDSIYSASINTARRASSPIKIAKLGNPQTGWIPGPEHEQKLLQLLAQAELDNQAWLVYHYGVQFEMVGDPSRVMNIKDHIDTIERIKLIALGINKGLLVGETSYASVSSGLQVFLQRMKAMRTFFEHKWILPKFFKVIAEINGWVRRSPAEINHRFRIKRSQRELLEEKRYIIPDIVWEKSLDPAVDANLINAMQVLESLGVKFSKTTKMATVGMSFEEESNKIAQEDEFAKKFLPKTLNQQQQAPEGGGGGMMSGGEPPPPPPGGEAPPSGETPPPPPEGGGGEAPPAPEGAALHKEAPKKEQPKMKMEKIEEKKPGKSTIDGLKSSIWTDDKYGNWHADEVVDLIKVFKTGQSDSGNWDKLAKDKAFEQAYHADDTDAMWQACLLYLDADGMPLIDINELEKILQAESILSTTSQINTQLDELEKLIPEANTDLYTGDTSTPKLKLNGDITAKLAAAKKKLNKKSKRKK